MRLLPYIAAFLVAGLLIAWVARPDAGGSGDDVVASVEGETIAVEEFRAAYVDYLNDTGLPDTARRRADFLDRLIGIQLVVADARRRGLDDDPELRVSTDRATEKLEIDFYVQRVALDTVSVSEADLREMFLRMNTSIHARHLFAQTVDEAQALKDQLDAGESFEQLAEEVFDDPSLANSGGDLGYFGFDEMDPTFEDVAYVLPVGEVSQPVRTSNGYSVLQVLDRQSKPLITESEFATRKDKVEQYVLYRRHAYAKKNLVLRLVSEADVAYNDRGLELLMGFIDGSVELAGEEPTAAMLSEPYVNFLVNGKRLTWNVGQFREHAQEASPDQREAVRSEAHLRQFTDGLVAREVMLDQFRAENWKSEDDFIRVQRNTVDRLVYDFAYRKHVEAISIPPDSVRQYFEQHSSEFTVGPTLLVDEIIVGSRVDARAARSALAIESFASVAARVSERPGADQSGGRLGYVTRGQLGVLADTLFATPAGSTIGPIEVAGRFGIFRVVEEAEAQQASFDDVRDDIEKLLRHKASRDVLRGLVDSLRNEFSVTKDVQLAQSLDLRQARGDG